MLLRPTRNKGIEVVWMRKSSDRLWSGERHSGPSYPFQVVRWHPQARMSLAGSGWQTFAHAYTRCVMRKGICSWREEVQLVAQKNPAYSGEWKRCMTVMLTPESDGGPLQLRRSPSDTQRGEATPVHY